MGLEEDVRLVRGGTHFGVDEMWPEARGRARLGQRKDAVGQSAGGAVNGGVVEDGHWCCTTRERSSWRPMGLLRLGRAAGTEVVRALVGADHFWRTDNDLEAGATYLHNRLTDPTCDMRALIGTGY